MLSDSGHRGPRSDNFDGRVFRNIEATQGKSLFDVVIWKMKGESKDWPNSVPQAVRREPMDSLENGEMAFSVVNHATVLIQMGGINILTDPIWSKRCSPFQHFGPQRVRPPAIEFESLPRIHYVLISHNHYDHFDEATVKRLRAKHDPLFVVGLGNRAHLKELGVSRILEMDWWQSFSENGLSMYFVPAQHFSGRGLRDRNRTLWGGFYLKDQGASIYFAGDTGYGRLFKSIHDRLGPPDVSFIPIGAYEPRSFMREMHVNPDEAVQAHLDLKSKMSVGIHFGTFQLTDEGIDDPRRELAMAKGKLGVTSFVSPEFGERVKGW